MKYETPAIAELGTVADFTRADFFASGSDGSHFFGFPLGNNDGNGQTTS